MTTNEKLQALQLCPQTRFQANQELSPNDWDRFMRTPNSPRWFSDEEAERIYSRLMLLDSVRDAIVRTSPESTLRGLLADLPAKYTKAAKKYWAEFVADAGDSINTGVIE